MFQHGPLTRLYNFGDVLISEELVLCFRSLIVMPLETAKGFFIFWHLVNWKHGAFHVTDKDHTIEFFIFKAHINDNDSVHTYSQYLLYNLNTKIATLKKKVRLTDDKTNLYTEELEYDVNQKIGIYRNGGRVVNGTSVLTSNEGTYYADLKDVYFKQNVVLKDPKYDLKSDSLLYNTNTEIATFISETFIIDSRRFLWCLSLLRPSLPGLTNHWKDC